MSYYSLWIDTAHAYVYKFTPNGVEETKIEAHGSKEHAHESTDKFYHEVAGKLVNAKELMIMGPGVAKDQFKHHCEDHHHQHLANAIVGVKAMESHPTKAMMLEKAGDFFKSYHSWTKNY
jgi:stalled ribosome rescue protein Dom34